MRALKPHLFDEELLAHGHALVEPLLVALQHLLLLIHLSPQVTVSLCNSNDSTQLVKQQSQCQADITFTMTGRNRALQICTIGQG